MKFVQAQFSLKYEPRWKIRRDANHIEDLLQEYYGTPQIMPQRLLELYLLLMEDIAKLIFPKSRLILL